MTAINPYMISALKKSGLIKNINEASFEVLMGGVSSDIWKITTPDRIVCVKQALPKLRVKADWFAPVERNKFEVTWYSIANDLVPGSAPEILMQDKVSMLFAMNFLDPDDHKLWKSELRDGHVSIKVAGQVGTMLAKIHSGTANNVEIAKQFPRTDIFLFSTSVNLKISQVMRYVVDVWDPICTSY